MIDKKTEKGEKPEPTPEEILEVEISKLVTGGAGLGRLDGLAVFVPLTAVGDRVRARVQEKKKGFIRASLDEVLEPGPGRREAPCPHFGQCGGCDLQHLEIETQRAAKTEIVLDCFQRLGKMDVTELLVAPARDDSAGPEFGYRNRIRFFASPSGPYGMMRRGTNDIVPLEQCPLMPEAFNRDILPWLRFLPPVEQIVVRMDGKGGWLISVFGQAARLKIMKKILNALEDGEAPAPGCQGLLFNGRPVWGRDHLLHTVAGHTFRVGSQSFFQGNHAATEFAIGRIRIWLEELKDQGMLGTLLGDFYCGVGLFTLTLADLFEKVVAIDSDVSSIRDARNNVQRDGRARDKVTVIEGPVARVWNRSNGGLESEWSGSTCVVDPPRAGLGKDGVATIGEVGPRHLVYMSCDPATLARDAAALAEKGYTLCKLEVLDMFPQTGHIESLMLMERAPEPA